LRQANFLWTLYMTESKREKSGSKKYSFLTHLGKMAYTDIRMYLTFDVFRAEISLKEKQSQRNFYEQNKF